jgi:hypothetical protein
VSVDFTDAKLVKWRQHTQALRWAGHCFDVDLLTRVTGADSHEIAEIDSIIGVG